MSKKYTVITGASSGIGYETALAFGRKREEYDPDCKANRAVN